MKSKGEKGGLTGCCGEMMAVFGSVRGVWIAVKER